MNTPTRDYISAPETVARVAQALLDAARWAEFDAMFPACDIDARTPDHVPMSGPAFAPQRRAA